MPMCMRRWISSASSLKLLLASGTALSPADDRLDEEGREGQPDALALEFAPQPLARPDDARHVGLHDRGDVRRGLLAQHHVPGDGLAHRRERDNLVICG